MQNCNSSESEIFEKSTVEDSPIEESDMLVNFRLRAHGSNLEVRQYKKVINVATKSFKKSTIESLN